MPLNQTHKSLIRETLRNSSEIDQPRKKRRRAPAPAPAPSPVAATETVDIDSESTDDFEDVDLENVDLDAIATYGRVSTDSTPGPESSDRGNIDVSTEKNDDSDSEVDSDDFDDLEDVDMDIFNNTGKNQDTRNETLTFSINDGQKEIVDAKKKRTFTPISKDERKSRKLIHKLVLFSMVCHGAVRNKWCSDKRLLTMLRRTVSQEIANLFDQDDTDVLDYVKSKRFIDGLRKLSTVFSRKFKVSSPGIQRKDWGPKEVSAQDQSKAMTFDKFMKTIKTFQGNRDIGAQAFVAILRSIGINARLVFSVQVPDYRSLRPAKNGSNEEKEEQKPAKISNKPKSEFDPVFIPNPRQALLSGIRSRKKKESDKAKQKAEIQSNYPVFWIEVWNKYSKKWVTIDPIIFNVVEVMPMRRKCKFEAPATDETHQTWYVIAYDKFGTVKDVTRRYTQYYNAKTAKRRIAFASEEDEHWYNRMLRSVNKPKKSITKAEAMELKEFYDRHVCEGTPNNMADFKNHPVYALEPQLRQDEIIYPQDETSKCGTFRSSNKSSIMPVYKRSCVHKLKTSKAWHMSGRVLKVGAQPLKTKKAQVQFTEEEGDDDGQVRLYAEFQTELYKPPPIIDGKISKNAYGNVEIFRPTMIPENGFLVPVSRDVSMKMLENAARWILNIDYAKAIVSFEFGKGQKTKRAPTAKEGGILIDVQYKEGVLAVLEGLQEQEEQERRESVELNALRSWNFFLKKLQIIKRLDRNHGTISEEAEDDEDNFEAKEKKLEREKDADEEEEDGYFSVASEDEASDNDAYVPRPTKRSQLNQQSPGIEADEDDFGGGFLIEEPAPDHENEEFIGGGFLPADASVESSNEVAPELGKDVREISDTEGGFIVEPEDPQATIENTDDGRSLIEHDQNKLSTPELPHDSDIKTDEIAIFPKRENYPRRLRSRSHLIDAADATLNAPRALNQEAEVINLDSDEVERKDQFPDFPIHEQRRRSSRISRSMRKNSTGSGISSEIGGDIDDEEKELEIEYSDSA